MTVKNDGLQEILSGGIPTSEPDLSASPREAERLDREWEHFTVCFMLPLQIFLAKFHLHLRDDALDAGRIVIGSDDEHIALQRNEIAIEPLNESGDTFRHTDNRVAAIAERHSAPLSGLGGLFGRRDDGGNPAAFFPENFLFRNKGRTALSDFGNR